MDDTGMRNGWSGVGAHGKEHGIQMDDFLSGSPRGGLLRLFFALLSLRSE